MTIKVIIWKEYIYIYIMSAGIGSSALKAVRIMDEIEYFVPFGFKSSKIIHEENKWETKK